MKFIIKEGKVRPPYWQRALWLIRQGIFTRKTGRLWRVRFEKPLLDTHIKLLGLFDFAPGFTHGESRRVIAHFERQGVRLTSYLYIDGKGPATGGHNFAHVELCFVPYNIWEEIYINEWLYIVENEWSASYPDLYWGASFRSFAGAHADNGPNSPCAPCDLRFEIEVA